jgi:Domain of unknown function (DUF4249)
MNWRRFFLLIFLVGDGCIKPLDIELTTQQENIVVDGMITDQPGPYKVKLFKTKALNSQLEGPDWVRRAIVTIFDDQGNSEILKESSTGNYETKPLGGIQGTIGRSYYIKIVTSDQVVYESQPEKLKPVADIEKLYYEFNLQEDPGKSDHLLTTNGFNFFVETRVIENGNNIRWRINGIYEVKTSPELKTITKGGAAGSVVVVPDPPICSGWSYTPKKGLTQGDKPCTCCNCWISEYNDSPLLADLKFVNSGQLLRKLIYFIPANRRQFSKKYFIEVEQFSISENAYNFWNKVSQQQKNGSDLFQVPPPKTVGNIITITSGAPSAIGFFSASSVKSKSMFIDKSSIPYGIPEIDVIPESCQQLSKYSSNIKPLFW